MSSVGSSPGEANRCFAPVHSPYPILTGPRITSTHGWRVLGSGLGGPSTAERQQPYPGVWVPSRSLLAG
jgi:hypothetical protein